MTTFRLAVIAGDGIGKEVIPVGLDVLRQAGRVTGRFEIVTRDLPWSCEYYLAHGVMMPADGLSILAEHDAVYLGAVGFPGVPDHVSLHGLLLPIRREFDQYVNLRPIRVLDGIASPLRLRDAGDIDMLCVRENTEGEYVGIGGRFKRGTPDDTAFQTSVFTRRGIERVARYAFAQARGRRRRLVSATKSNALQYSMVLWDEVIEALAAEFVDVQVARYHVDALAARFVTHPESIDVVVASNLFGDILTDLGGALQGSLGLAASGNINPQRRFPSMFEPVHGSAPDIAGRGIANPLAAVWAAAMLLDHLKEVETSALIMQALERVARDGPHTPDLGGNASTREVGAAITNVLATLTD